MPARLPSEISKVDPAAAWQPWKPDAKDAWNEKWVHHLFRRASFGPTSSDVKQAMNDGLEPTVERLIKGEANAAERLALITDSGAHIAEQGNPDAVRGWWIYAMIHSGHPLREKLSLFWHNHFATSIDKVRRPDLMVKQNHLIRQHALGKFPPFLLEMSKDPAMLIWLDSNRNIKGAPNENYAREVMELFSLGVGNYTEKDVQEAARAFTGWHTDGTQSRFEFNATLHDEGEKTILRKTGNWNGDDVLRIALEQPAASIFLVKKFYRELVSETEPPLKLIEPLARQYAKSDYDTADLVKTILLSSLFYSEHAYRKKVKSPVEYALGVVRSSWTKPPAPSNLVSPLNDMGQALFSPPNVKGWRGGTNWLNSATLLTRNNFAERVAMGTLSGSVPLRVDRFSFPIQPPMKGEDGPQDTPVPPEGFDVASSVREAKLTDPTAIAEHLTNKLLGGDVPKDVVEKLAKFIGRDNPKDKELFKRVREAAHAIMCLPEYQLS
jgi:hypothetical protein